MHVEELVRRIVGPREQEGARLEADFAPGMTGLGSHFLRRCEWFTQKLAGIIVESSGAARLRFGQVGSEDEWREICHMRRRVYERSLPYLLQELDLEGKDRYDNSSFVFAAWWDGRIVATIRATRYPFETLKYVAEPVLAQWLGDGWKEDYIEWGRLLVDGSAGLNRLSPALITYAGLHLLLQTPYRKYFGYTRPHVRKLLSRFRLEDDSLEFSIPHRGTHSYCLLKGDIRNDAVSAFPGWLKTMTHKCRDRLRLPNEAMPAIARNPSAAWGERMKAGMEMSSMEAEPVHRRTAPPCS